MKREGRTHGSIFAGIEVDILGDGTLDLSDSVLEQMDIVIASVHSHFNQDRDTMTARLLKAGRRGKQIFYSIPDCHVREMLTNMIEHLAEPHEQDEDMIETGAIP